jgi:prepilin-type N-terminal cleavage/methylation domain-containing protein
MTLTMPTRGTDGFTLIEAMIVIVMLAIVTAAVFPKISTVMSHSHVNQAAMVVANDLAVAASNAARERKPMRLARGSDHQSITVTDRTSGTLLSTRHLGAGDAYQLDSVVFSTSPVDIFPNGFTSSALTITLWSKSYSRQVTMSLAGWVRTQ